MRTGSDRSLARQWAGSSILIELFCAGVALTKDSCIFDAWDYCFGFCFRLVSPAREPLFDCFRVGSFAWEFPLISFRLGIFVGVFFVIFARSIAEVLAASVWVVDVLRVTELRKEKTLVQMFRQKHIN